MILDNQCRSCESYDIVKTNCTIICFNCSEEYTLKKKKYNTNKSGNKIIHCKNVLVDIAYNTSSIDKSSDAEIKKIIYDNNIDSDFVSTSLVTEYLKSKNIKSYKETYRLLNSCKNITISNEKFNIPKILSIFDHFINYLFYTNYKGTISYNHTLYKILKSLQITDNLKPIYTKSTNKKDYRDKLWNDFILFSRDRYSSMIKFKYVNDYTQNVSYNMYNVNIDYMITID